MNAMCMNVAACVLAAVALQCVIVCGEEMSGGGYSIEISAVTAGGGSAAAAGDMALWGAGAQPLAQGKMSGGGGYNLFSGVYTPVIPEAAGAIALALAGTLLARRRSN